VLGCSLLVAVWTACALALTSEVRAEVEVAASAQPQSVAVGETLTYEISVTISGPGALGMQPQPALPELDSFDIVSTGTRQSMTMGSGGMASTRTYTYLLRAREPGSFTLEPASVELAGRTYKTGRVQVNVTSGSSTGQAASLPPPPAGSQVSAPAAKPDQYIPTSAIDLRLTAQPQNPYVGQQVILTFTFYQSESLYSDTHYEPPKAENFVTKELAEPENVTRVLGDREYLVQQRRWAAFPTTPGLATIEPVKVTAATHPMMPAEDRYTNTVELNVRPLPPPAGKQFEGAVGKFTAELSVDRTSVKAGETFTLRLIVRGAGNLHSLGAPAPEVPEWVKIYRSREDRTSAPGYGGDADSIGGEARFEFLALAKRPGTVKVPQIELVYFNPATGRYETSRTQGVSVQVAPGAVVAEAPSEETGQMRYIMAKGPGKPPAGPLVLQPWFWAVQALPLLALVTFGYLAHRSRTLLANPELARALQAPKLARAHLHEARQALASDDSARFCTAVSHALTDFIAHRTGLEAADISTTEAIVALREAGIDAELVGRVEGLLRRCDYGRFAAAGRAEYDEMLQTSRRLLAELSAQKLGGH